ncbi:MAG TPA: class I SAM-dependent methyltransferase [Gammaproteobacteria bacterium]|nr:class I SAM-dependent methyltransferase [Gammaproteobacteria bacterium]
MERNPSKTPKGVNKGNATVYSTLFSGEEGLAPLYTRSKLHQHADFAVLKQQGLLPPNIDAQILVIGPGDGRDIHYLILAGYTNIVAVERDPQAVKKLLPKYGHKVHIVNQDIMGYNQPDTFQFVFWMWCGISDFSEEEQQVMIDKVMTFLSPGGVAL